MLSSMTGYGRVKSETAQQEITVEIRSVNHRYLDLNIKVPRIYGFLEDKIKPALNAQLVRGKVDVFVSVRAKDGADIKISPNMAVLDGYMSALRSISERFGVPCEVSALDLARLPDALASEKEEADQEELTAGVLDVLEPVSYTHLDVYKRQHQGLFAFTVQGKSSAEVCQKLAERDICLRDGLHCSPLAHRSAGTLPDGACRVSFSCFNTLSEVKFFLSAVKKMLTSP